MRKVGASGALSMYSGSMQVDDQYNAESEPSEKLSDQNNAESEPSEELSDQNNAESEPSEELSEPFEEFSKEIVSQPNSDNENDCSGQLTEEPGDEGASEPLEESDYEPSENIDSRNEQIVGFLSEEEEVESTEVKLKQSDEKKRPLGAKDRDYHLSKKWKPAESLGPESYVGSALACQNASEVSKDFANAVKTSGQQEHSGSSGKRRRSRWDPQPKSDLEVGESDRTSKRRKTRWAADDSQLKMLGPIILPDFVKKLVEADMDPVIMELKQNLLMINRRLQEVHGDGPRVETSRSPHPVDVRSREELIQDRQNIIGRLIEKNPTFKPPSDYKPKLYKKLYIPSKEYPEYNFIGLIIGPRGHTQKRMEKETGARILLRGKGSSKDRKPTQKPDPSDDEDLHVLVEADSQKSLDDAVRMVEKLLLPVNEGMNEHKRAQLRELAELNGKLREGNQCKNCGEGGHVQYACPSKNSILSSALSCVTCGGGSHSTANCPLTMPTPGSNLANQQKSFHADVGGARGFAFSTPKSYSHIPWQSGDSGFGIQPSHGSNYISGPGSNPTTAPQSSSHIPWQSGNSGFGIQPSYGSNYISGPGSTPTTATQSSSHIPWQSGNSGFGISPSYGSNSISGPASTSTTAPQSSSHIPWQSGNSGFGISPSYGSTPISGPGSTPTTDEKFSKEDDIFVRELPPTVHDLRMRELFSPFGRLLEAKVIKDRSTGCSKGYGFVKYENPINAAAAVEHMNGYKIDGKALVVRLAGKRNAVPWFQSPAVVSQDSPRPGLWPGPPGSVLPDPQLSSTKHESFVMPPSSVFLGHSDSSSERLPSSHHVPISPPSSLMQFPGNPDYHRSQFISFVTPPSNFSQPPHLTPSPGSSISSFPWTSIPPP